MIQSFALTGATGFVGGHLLRALLKRKVKISCLLRNPDKLFLKQGVEKLPADITSSEIHEELVDQLRGCGTFIHLAAEINTEDTEQLYNVNVKGALHVFELAKQAGIKRFVFISSSNTHGELKSCELPAREEMHPRPFMDYGQSKLEAEEKLCVLAKNSTIDLAILKPTQIYGPNSYDYIWPMVNSLAQNKGLRGMPFMSGLIKTNPIFISDVIEAILIASDSPDQFKGERFFLAGPEITTSYHIAKVVANCLRGNNPNPKIRIAETIQLYAKDIISLLRGKIRHWIYSGEKAKEFFGFAPKVGIKQGVALTVEWILNEKKNLIGKSA